MYAQDVHSKNENFFLLTPQSKQLIYLIRVYNKEYITFMYLK